METGLQHISKESVPTTIGKIAFGQLLSRIVLEHGGKLPKLVLKIAEELGYGGFQRGEQFGIQKGIETGIELGKKLGPGVDVETGKLVEAFVNVIEKANVLEALSYINQIIIYNPPLRFARDVLITSAFSYGVAKGAKSGFKIASDFIAEVNFRNQVYKDAVEFLNQQYRQKKVLDVNYEQIIAKLKKLNSKELVNELNKLKEFYR